MKGRYVTAKAIAEFKEHLILEERSEITIEKYIRDVKAFSVYTQNTAVTKEIVIAYKKHLQENYAVRSVNSMLASINSLFSFLGWHDLKVKSLKLQQQVFCPEEKELTKAEYARLCRAAERKHNERLNLILQTICGTGIRVSELQYITVEAVKQGEAVVNCKAKTRSVFIVKELKQKLLRYAAEQNIKSGITCAIYLQGCFTVLKRILQSLQTFSVTQALTPPEFILFQPERNTVSVWRICS